MATLSFTKGLYILRDFKKFTSKAVPNITVAIGSARELMPSEILFSDSTDYLLGGALTLKNGRIDKFQFDEGYCQAESLNATQDNFTFLYYDKDHLGNVRQVTKAMGSTGTVMQTMNYYPSALRRLFLAMAESKQVSHCSYGLSKKLGAQFCDGSAASGDVQPYKYNGKELDKMHGLNTYDYGARQYNPVTARWDRVDPLCEKYYSVSPYVYGRNNPVMFVDPDGRKIVLAGGVSNSFKQDYALTVQTFEENGCNDVWKLLNESLEVYTIVEGNGDGNYFDPSTKTISWNSRKGLYTNNDVYLSPATRLNHELSHALQFDTNPKQYDKDNTTVIDEDDNTYTIEEKRVIEGIETQTAMCLGEINSGEITRYDHSGTTFVTNSPISNKDLNHIEIIIYPQNKQ